uniref:nicotinate-nucleotide--dimethylbenzimidazole phosphoribosyltransferase n=1 Tax=Thaumasiovibrio occultus TaxID=1891184 RepID=UPI000B356A14|nr:nicotinate-nucleotide--dimethylbenzimidazole phosphoribosyltransferase [Thaumasiovibrio occultus]
MFQITAPDMARADFIQRKIDSKTKPQGSLGKLESVAWQLALLQQTETISVTNPHILTFAGDHGISRHGLSIAPSEVTTQMVNNFLTGGAAINCFCRTNNVNLSVIDAGTKLEAEDHPDLIKQRLGNGTLDFTEQPAMSIQTVLKGLGLGAQQAVRVHQTGCNVIGFGEMGICNSSSAAALMAATLKIPASECVGYGTGISPDQLRKKTALIQVALDIHQSRLTSPLSILSVFGGFEIVQMVGGMLKAAELQMTILVDGFITTAAALMAYELYPEVLHYFIFCHQSEEQGHRLMLEHLKADPILHLDLRLGEGTGAALAVPLLRAACEFYNTMATFDQAGVEPVNGDT